MYKNRSLLSFFLLCSLLASSFNFPKKLLIFLWITVSKHYQLNRVTSEKTPRWQFDCFYFALLSAREIHWYWYVMYGDYHMYTWQTRNQCSWRKIENMCLFDPSNSFQRAKMGKRKFLSVLCPYWLKRGTSSWVRYKHCIYSIYLAWVDAGSVLVSWQHNMASPSERRNM